MRLETANQNALFQHSIAILGHLNFVNDIGAKRTAY